VSDIQTFYDEVRADVKLVEQIPIYSIPNYVEFTLDQHQAFIRLIDAIPKMVEALERVERVAATESDPEAAATMMLTVVRAVCADPVVIPGYGDDGPPAPTP
jgi:hypothetical protein